MRNPSSSTSQYSPHLKAFFLASVTKKNAKLLPLAKNVQEAHILCLCSSIKLYGTVIDSQDC